MNDFDVLFCVVLRLKDTDIDSLDEKVENHASTIGDCISTVYKDCFVAPLGMEEVGKDDVGLNILRYVSFDEE